METKDIRDFLDQAKTDEQKERAMFATLLVHLVSGSMDEVLRNAPVGVCQEFGRIWDAYRDVPTGVIFQRPNFEEYEALHTGANIN